MLLLAFASLRRAPVLFAGLFATVALAAALIAFNGEAMAAALTAPHSPGQDLGGVLTVLALGGVVSAFVTLTGVLSTTGLTVALRQRDLGLLRLVGASGTQLRLIVLAETTVLSATAGLTGCAIAAVLSGPAISLLNRTGLSPTTLTADLNPLPLLIAWAGTLLLSTVGSLLAARRVTRLTPAEALRTAAVDLKVLTPRRWVPGTLSVCGGAVMILIAHLSTVEVATPLTIFGAIALAIGAVAWAPVLLPLLGRLLLAPLRALPGATARIAAASLAVSRRRTAAITAPVLAAVAIIGTLTAVLHEANIATGASAEQTTLNNTVLLVLTAPALLYVLIASASAQIMTYTTRCEELHNMRLLGISRPSILAISIAESASAALLGTLAGLAVSLTALLAYRSALARELGHSITIDLPWTTLATICSSCVLVLITAGAAAANAQTRPASPRRLQTEPDKVAA